MIALFARHPTAGNLLMLLFLVIGLLALPSLRRETFPEFVAESLAVRAVYPGASAEDVEEAICQRVEDAVDGVSDVDEVRCVAREGLGETVVEMEEGGDFARLLDDVKTQVDAIDDFPDEVETPVVEELGRTSQVITVAIGGPMGPTDLKAYAEGIKDRMQRDPAISQVDVLGFSDHQLRIEVPASALQRYELSISDVADAVRRQGVDLPAGGLETHDRDLLIRFTDLRRTPEALAELRVVSAASGAEVRLGDIARISDRFELDEERTLLNGRRVALLQVLKNKQQDTLRVMAAVTRFLDEARREAPPGVELTLTQDSASIVRDRLRLLITNGLQGLILVFLTMWLFFQGRFAFWVAMGLPVSFLGALFFMSVLGLTINMITMVALLMALGLLMDDAIVISENIASHLHLGKTALQAAIDGTRQVGIGVFSSFVTSVAVFAPLAFLAGEIGQVLKFIPMVLILVLAVSLVEAFLILPHHLAHSLAHHSTGRGRVGRWVDTRLEHFRDHGLGRAVDLAVRHRYAFIGLVIGLFLASLGTLAGGLLKFQSFPDIEGDRIEARLMLPQGTPLWRTEAAVQRITDALQAMDAHYTPMQPEGERLVRNVQVRFNNNPDAGETGAHLATVSVDLLTAERRHGRIDDMIAHWREGVGTIPDALALTFKEPVIGPGGIPLEVRLSGPDLDVLKRAALELRDWLARYRGVTDLADDLRAGKPELRLHLRDGALALGLDANRVASQLRAAFYGTTAKTIQVGPESIDIQVMLAEADQSRLTDVEDFRVTTPAGDQVPLSVVARIEPGRGHSSIHRVNGVRSVTVSGDLDGRIANAREVIEDTRARLFPRLRDQYPGLSLEVLGQSKEGAKTGASMLRGFGIGLIGVFILLSFQFRSYVEPLVVMSIIPLALIGVIWGHLLMGLKLSMPSMIGFTSLAGVVVNDSILLMEFLRRRVGEGRPAVEAATLASRERFRAILLTSVTTIAGLTPLLLEKSMQAQVLIPLAVSIVFGLLASTLLVLLVVPALVTILDDLGLFGEQAREGSSAEPG